MPFGTDLERERHVMTVPGTGGRMRFDGTLTVGNVLIVLSMVGSLAWILVLLGGAAQRMQDAQSYNAQRLSRIELRLGVLETQAASMQDQIHLIQQQNAAFARSLGAPLPSRLQPAR